jgi:flagellar basal body-associated protein FliL
MSLIKPKKRRGPKLLWLIIVILVIVAAGAGYVYFTISSVSGSDEMKASYVDYISSTGRRAMNTCTTI